jgi:type IV fimbrial biogenesis protein FimT
VVIVNDMLGHFAFWMLKMRKTGFTLIELLLALTITIIVIGMGLPSIRTMIVNQQIRSSSDSVLSGLQLAKSEAMKRNARVYFSLVTTLDNNCAKSSSGLFWVVSRDDPDGACGTAVSSTVAPRILAMGQATDTSGKIAYNGTSGAAATNMVGFNGNGFVAANPDASTSMNRIDVTTPNLNSTTLLAVQVASAGRIKMCNVSAPAGDPRACD